MDLGSNPGLCRTHFTDGSLKKMSQINLLKSLPPSKRDVKARHIEKNEAVVAESKKFGQAYFDGPRSYGYGGYHYDGRWRPVAKDIVAHYALKPGMRVLDVGCAKGFLVKDLLETCPGIQVFGLDISEYALKNCPSDIIGRLHLGNATSLPFPDNSFDLVLSINTLHNLKKDHVVKALQEIERVGRGKSFIQVDAYETPEQKAIFEDWVLTAEFHDYPQKWLAVLEEAGYKGDYDWTIIES